MSYLTAAEVRERQAQRVGSVTKYPDAALEDLIAAFERLAERFRGVAYEVREHTLYVPEGHGPTVVLPWPMVAEVDEILVYDDEVTGFTLDAAAGILHGLPTHGALQITYSHGMAETPPEVKRACALYVAREAQADTTATQDNAFAVIAPDGSMERRSTPDWAAGRPTGWIDVDRILGALEDYRSGGLA